MWVQKTQTAFPNELLTFHYSKETKHCLFLPFHRSSTMTRDPFSPKKNAGDAGSRIQESSYYDRAIAFYNDTLVQPLFWIESNDPSWAYLKQLKAKWPEDFMEPNKSTEPLAAFHRMVMADGFVMSISSLSYAAALLRLSKLKTVIPKMALNESPKLFFETPLFLVI
jgi:hypothetical protein